jgi:RNA recognition motif-containing protein
MTIMLAKLDCLSRDRNYTEREMKSAYPRVFVAKLAHDIGDHDLYEFFSRWCEVRSAKVVMDRETGASKGFGFVELPDEATVEQALQLNDYEFRRRRLVVT